MSEFEVHPILEAGQIPREGLWYVVSPEDRAECPSARVGACANFVSGECGGRVLLSAGATPEGPYSDLHELHIDKGSYRWHALPSRGLPPRYEQAAFLVGSQLHLFGGAHKSGPLNDLWKYEGESGQWVAVPSSGPIPSPRTLHTTTSTSTGTGTGPGGTRSQLVVFSGGAAGSCPVEDTAVHLFDPSSSQWSLPPTSGTPPSPRQGHLSAVVGSRLFVHGGMAGQEIYSDLHTLDLEKWAWSKPKVGGTLPPPLAAHGCAVLGKRLYVFGGLSHAGASDVLYYLDTADMQWREVSVLGPPPPSRLDHAMCSIVLPVPGQKSAESGTSPQAARTSPQETQVKPSGARGKEEAPSDSLTELAGQTGSPDTESPQKPSATASVSVKRAGVRSNTSTSTTTTTVTVLSPEDLETQDVCVYSESGATSASVDVNVDATAAKMAQMSVSPAQDEPRGTVFLPALFVFGGMDTSGTVHEDSFVIVPPH